MNEVMSPEQMNNVEMQEMKKPVASKPFVCPVDPAELEQCEACQ